MSVNSDAESIAFLLDLSIVSREFDLTTGGSP